MGMSLGGGGGKWRWREGGGYKTSAFNDDDGGFQWFNTHRFRSK